MHQVVTVILFFVVTLPTKLCKTLLRSNKRHSKVFLRQQMCAEMVASDLQEAQKHALLFV